MMSHTVQLTVQRAAPRSEPARGLLVVLGQDGHGPGAFGQDRVVEPGDLLRAEQHQRRVQRDRSERADRHGVAAPGGDHDDPARELARGPPERGVVHFAHRARVPARRTPASNDRPTPASEATVPPYRYHLPAVLSVMITLPLETGMDSTNEAIIQPSAGPRPPAGRWPAVRRRTRSPRTVRSGCTGSCRSGPPPRRPGTGRRRRP